MDNHEEIATKLREFDKRLDSIESNMNSIATKEDIEEIVRKTLIDVLFKAGRGTKAIIVTVAIVFGSIAVISGGVKWLLGLIGFQYLK